LSTADYELVLMLDPEVPDERRDQIASEARKRIESSGSLTAEKAWGMRKLAYEIRQRTEADYRFFRFETESALLDELDHSLKITDGVLRFRIFKVDPESPVIEPPPPVSLASSAPGRGPGARRGPGRGRDHEARGPEPVAPAAAAPAPAAAEPAPSAESAPAEQAAEQPAEPTPSAE
jgi:small subunit ribosomal protein S6